MNVEEQSIGHIEFCAMLKEKYGEDHVDLWHTGGGIMNPILVFDRDENGEVGKYVMFTDGWSVHEASFSYHDDTVEWSSEGVHEWASFEEDHVPMEKNEILQLIDGKLNDWGLAL